MDKCECLDEILSSFEGRREELIPILQRVQERIGYLPEEAMHRIARFARVPESAVWAVATFYGQFRFAPVGRRHIVVCRGASCHVRGARRIEAEIERQLGIKPGEATPDGKYSLGTVGCLGLCARAPCVLADHEVAGDLTCERVAQLLREATDDGNGS